MKLEVRGFSLLFRGRLFALPLLLCSLVATSLCGQEIRIRVLNGRNGHPVTNECVNVWLGDLSVQPGHSPAAELLIPTDKSGVATLRLATEETQGVKYRHTTACNGGGEVDVVVGYAATLGIMSDYYVPCQPSSTDSPTLPFSVKKILRSGDVTGNTCGKVEASPKPGELIFFVRPMHWWERTFR